MDQPWVGSNGVRAVDRSRRWRTAFILTAIVAVIASVTILVGGTRTRGGYDQVNYHERAIRTFAEQMPAVDLRDYMSATTPGYHLVIGAISRVIHGRDHAAASVYSGPNAPELLARQRTTLQFIGLGFTLVWAGVMGWWLGARIGRPAWGVIIALPLFASVYVAQSAAWLLPDNAAWCCVALMMLLALRRPSPGVVIAMGAVLFVGVWMRQIHLWTAGLVVAAVWLGVTLERDERELPGSGPMLAVKDLWPRDPGRWTRAMMLAGVAIVPAVAVVAAFYRLWGGHLVPPSFVEWHNSGRVQPATAAFVLTLIGLLTVPFAGFLIAPAREALRSHRGLLSVAALLGVVVSLIGPTTATSPTGGRFGALWSLVAKFPSFGDRAILLCAASAFGAVCVACWLLGMPRRARWIMLAAVVGFALAQSFNPQLWQRYHEPFALLWITVAVGLVVAGGVARTDRRWVLIGPLTLAAAFIWLGVSAIRSSPQADDDGNRLGHIIAPGVVLPKGESAKPATQ